MDTVDIRRSLGNGDPAPTPDASDSVDALDTAGIGETWGTVATIDNAGTVEQLETLEAPEESLLSAQIDQAVWTGATPQTAKAVEAAETAETAKTRGALRKDRGLWMGPRGPRRRLTSADACGHPKHSRRVDTPDPDAVGNADNKASVGTACNPGSSRGWQC